MNDSKKNKKSLIEAKNFALFLIIFNMIILTILFIQQFLFLSEHQNYETILMALCVINFKCSRILVSC